MPADRIEKVGDARLQHGPMSDRVYLMELGEDADVDAVVEKIEGLVARHSYGKVFAKIPADALKPFLEAGYLAEARVPGLFGGRVAGWFMGKFYRRSRGISQFGPVSKALRVSRNRARSAPPPLPEGYLLREATPTDAEALCTIYREVFETYPFPIHDPDYLRKVMASHVDFFCICQGEEPVAVASLEKDTEHGCAEMTDFATLPAHRGKGFAAHLLQHMDRVAPSRGIQTGYTIARAASVGMNITFARCGYRYAGTLVNNTCIAGSIESMNVWYKPL